MDISHQKTVLEANRKFYNKISSFHDKKNSYIAKKNCRRFYENLMTEALRTEGKSFKNMRILELGCGSGNWYPFFIAQGVREYKGIDISENMIAEAQKKAPNASKEAFITGDAHEFIRQAKEANEKFDSIVSFSFLHHLAKPEEFLNDLKDVLSPGGMYFAFHEMDQKVPLALSHKIDTLFSLLFGYDTVEDSLTKRIRFLFSRILQKAIKEKHEQSTEFDWVEYQLNSKKFSPDLFAGKPQGYTLSSTQYGYYVYPAIAKVLGNRPNYFYLAMKQT